MEKGIHHVPGERGTSYQERTAPDTMFPLQGGISPTQSPYELILNQMLDFNLHCKVEFGEYVQTHEEHDNSMGPRTIGAVATRPTSNTQGGYYFIWIDTGRQIH